MKTFDEVRPGENVYGVTSEGEVFKMYVKSIGEEYLSVNTVDPVSGTKYTGITLRTNDTYLSDGGTVTTGISGYRHSSTIKVTADVRKAALISISKSHKVVEVAQERILQQVKILK